MEKNQRFTLFSGKTNTFLPIQHRRAHDLCFILHDIMLEHLVSGMSISAFTKEFVFRDNDDKRAFEMADDIFQWMEHSRRDEEKISLLVTLVVPAVLGDMLNCIYEALEASRKGKMAVAFMLLRKPLQEGLFLLEAILADKADFAGKLSSAPTLLWSQGAGGLEVHTNRINKVLDKIGERHRFDANYLAELRYDKSTGDGFDGICNQAMHLFTKHKSIETKPLNVNFVFVSEETHHSQWNYIYSRLPYIMVYLHKIVEHICHDIMPTDPVYLAQIERVIAASILLWWPNVTAQYADPKLEVVVKKTAIWLVQHCNEHGFRTPSAKDIGRMARLGSYPGETKAEALKRSSALTLLAHQQRLAERLSRKDFRFEKPTRQRPGAGQ